MIIKNFENQEQEWDDFIKHSFNGTVYHTRKFINYHPKNRFVDKSIMIYDDNILVCVIPVCLNNDKYFSHLGTTYGGPVIIKSYFKIEKLKKIIDLIFEYYDNKLEMRIANDIYFNNSQSSLIYLLQTKLYLKLELSWYITNFNIDNISNKFNRRHLLNIKKDKSILVFITDKIDDYIDFYKILENTLKNKHNTKPTHTLEEFLILKDIVNHKLCIVKNTDIIAGIYFIEVTKDKYYAFYITKNYKLENNYTTSCLLYVIEYFMNCIKPNLIDFGISTENKGDILNIGLSKFKEDSMTGISSYRYMFITK